MQPFTSCISLLFLVLSLTSGHFISSLSEKCNPDDKRALLQIKKEFGNPTKLSSWDPSIDCCNRTWWEGVSCDTDTLTYRVNYLDLSDLDLPQPVSFPPSITNLPFLSFLYISRIPNLVGPIPPSISNLSKLQYLYITQCNISGEIPNTFSQIKTLITIDFSYNNLSGPLPDILPSLPNFVGIAFDGNKLTGPIPESYGSFTKSFTVLTMSQNRLSGNIPASLGKLNLAYVDLSRNSLEGDASMLFGSEKEIQAKILLGWNKLAFDIGKVGLSKNLQALDLRNNKIYGRLPEELTKLQRLHKLNVSYNNLCGPIPYNRFDEYCYAHNKCLCGPPLPACKN
ncbi:polygalacturonase inhibitor 2-like [Vicia villosa]|uniref:polygalacturonase inhibitor 2-like n=1 Tax=Vicia villosa TaxID=3911 RepID=UPI00273CEE09|nr:polygalacturonase inhibitor 2-like [Vicia villosa]